MPFCERLVNHKMVNGRENFRFCAVSKGKYSEILAKMVGQKPLVHAILGAERAVCMALSHDRIDSFFKSIAIARPVFVENA